MEVQSGVQQPEPCPLGSPRSGADQQNEVDDRQMDAGGRPSTDNHSKDAQPATQKDDKKVSYRLPLLHICRRWVWVCLYMCMCVLSDEILPVCWAMWEISCTLSVFYFPVLKSQVAFFANTFFYVVGR